jgi:hypothetical protein
VKQHFRRNTSEKLTPRSSEHATPNHSKHLPVGGGGGGDNGSGSGTKGTGAGKDKEPPKRVLKNPSFLQVTLLPLHIHKFRAHATR